MVDKQIYMKSPTIAFTEILGDGGWSALTIIFSLKKMRCESPVDKDYSSFSLCASFCIFALYKKTAAYGCF